MVINPNPGICAEYIIDVVVTGATINGKFYPATGGVDIATVTLTFERSRFNEFFTVRIYRPDQSLFCAWILYETDIEIVERKAMKMLDRY